MTDSNPPARRRVHTVLRHLRPAPRATASTTADPVPVLVGDRYATFGGSAEERARAATIRKAVTPAEWDARVRLAAAYRAVALEGWDDAILNHLTVRVPGTHHFLINNFGEGFDEVCASSLVKVDTDGNVVLAGSPGAAVNRAGFVIHSTAHRARADARCVMHTHEDAVTAVACTQGGLLPLSQAALVCGDVRYHEYEGVAVSDAERASLKRDLGDRCCTLPVTSMIFARQDILFATTKALAVAQSRTGCSLSRFVRSFVCLLCD